MKHKTKKLNLNVINKTVEKTYSWVEEVMEDLDWDDEQKAYSALRVVLHSLRNHLPTNEMAQLGAQLPILIKGVYYDGWSPSHSPLTREQKKEGFLKDIEYQFRSDLNVNAQRVAKSVFRIISQHVSSGEIDDVVATLPADIKVLWTHLEGKLK